MGAQCRELTAIFVATAILACVPPPGSVLRLNDAAIGELDPHKGSDYADSILMFNVYDFLVRPGEGNKIAPDLATSWAVSDDGLSYKFKLRDDVVFHDSSPLRAADVVFSARRMLELNRGYSYLFPDYEVEALDSSTVQFRLRQPFAPFLASLVRLAIVNEDRVRANLEAGTFSDLGDYGSLFLSSKDAGSGAYRVVSHNPRELTVMQRLDDHFRGYANQAPEIVRLKYSMQIPTVRALMSRGEHEMTRMTLPREILQALAKEPDIELAVDVRASNHYIKLNTQRAPTDDVHFRRAMALAFDYEALSSLLEVTEEFRNGRPSRGPLPPGVLGYDPSAPTPRRDLQAARAELSLSRYAAERHSIEIQWVAEVGPSERIALLFQQNLGEIGMDVRVMRAPWALVLDRATRPETTPHANTVDVSAYTPDPDSILTAMYHSDNAGSWSSMEWLQDPQIDARIEEGRHITDLEVREKHYRQLARDLAALQPAIFTYESAVVIAKHRSVRAPRLDEPERAIATTGANYLFAEMSLGH